MGCLSENEVVELVEGRVASSSRIPMLEHLDDCERCREVVAETALAMGATSPTGQSLTRGPARFGVGDVVGRYRVTKKLGVGAMGMVLAAEHMDLRRRVALKVVLPSAQVDSEQLRVRLMREARAASAIRHANVVNVHDVLTLDDGSPVMVMDLLSGESLRDRLATRGPLSVGETLHVVRQVLLGLEAAHAQGVVHRDLKPDNIFLAIDEEGVESVKIVDFGIASQAVHGPAAQTAGLTRTGMLIGTPHYMAPEQAFAEGPVDARADLWAVGVVIYECLTGMRPFDGQNVGQVLKRLAQLAFAPLDDVAQGVPPALAHTVGRLLSERASRPSSAEATLEMLEGIDTKGAIEVVGTTTSGGLALEAGSWLARMRAPSPWVPILMVVVAVAAVLSRCASTGPSMRASRSLRRSLAEPPLRVATSSLSLPPAVSATASASASAPVVPRSKRPTPAPGPMRPSEPKPAEPKPTEPKPTGPLLTDPPF